MKNNKENYGFDVGDQVYLNREPDPSGVVVEIDDEHDLNGVTTCTVVWGVSDLADALKQPDANRDIQWTNKLSAISESTFTI